MKTTNPAGAVSRVEASRTPKHVGWLRAVWHAVLGAIGTVVGLAPHVMHHVGLLAGTALIAGAVGTAAFGILGLVAAIPFLLRLKRRFDSWWAPVIGLAVFTAMFSVSAFVIGPALSSGDRAPSEPPSPSQPSHTEHHP